MFAEIKLRVRRTVSSLLFVAVGPAALCFGSSNHLIATRPKIPTKSGQVFVVDDWDNKITKNDLGFNYFSGNTGAVELVEGTTTLTVSKDSKGSIGGSLEISFDFTGEPNEYAGYFASLFGLTDTKVSLEGNITEPNATTPFPGYFLDTKDIYRGFPLFPNRSVEKLQFDVRLESHQDITLKIEFKDEPNDGNDFGVFTYRTITETSGTWQTISLNIPNDFTNSVKGGGNTDPFDWGKVSTFAIIVEHSNVGTGVTNPDNGRFLVDNLVLIDTDGNYPDVNAMGYSQDGELDPNHEEAFLDLVRSTSFLYFRDWASTDPRTGGIIQDRSIFADLMSIGGVGFQLTSYVIGANQGYLSREAAAVRVRDILSVFRNQPQGPDRVGTIGYHGFFYHFLGIDGLRKQNFDFEATADIDESLNTVELSTIDTALAIAGVVTAGQYFDGDSDTENEIRSLADQIYRRVNWRFMLDDERFTDTKQFFLGWKPNEPRDDNSGRFGRFKLDDDPCDPKGQYSSKPDSSGIEVPATIDYYTDEGLLVALLAMGSPDPNHRVERTAWDAMIREDENEPFVKTYPGSLFTYQFASCWLDTKWLGTDNPDNNSVKPVDFFENTCEAIQATIDYAMANPKGRATLNEDRWGLSATEGPFDNYFAEAAPPAAIHLDGNEPMALVFGSGGPVLLEAEGGDGNGVIMPRGNASSEHTVWLHDGETRRLWFDLEGTAKYEIDVNYSNDNYGPLETVELSVDGTLLGSFLAQDTGDLGHGWDIFLYSGPVGSKMLGPGTHEVTVSVFGGDGNGVEIDFLSLETKLVPRPLEVGTVTNYGVGGCIVHKPWQAIEALWKNAQEDLNQDDIPELLHPRFGFADAFNLNVADALIEGAVHPNEPRILRAEGPWVNHTGFAIDHGPMLIMIDNYLNDQFIPGLFMSHPDIHSALSELFMFGDLNEDSNVDMIDFAMFARRWREGYCGRCCGAELTHDNQVSWDDLRELGTNWLLSTE